MASGWEHNWEIVKRLGEGGQGTVDLVRGIRRIGTKHDRARRLRTAVLAINAVIVKDQQLIQNYDEFETLLRDILFNDGTRLGALKQLHDAKDARDPERAEERLRREIDAMAQLKHPCLLRILNASTQGHWYISEYHPEENLTKSLDRFKGDVPGVLRAVRPLVEGVEVIHKAGFVHRDIKPDNVFLASDGRLVLGDFGLVFFEDDKHQRLSKTLDNVGSRDWMPPWAQGMRIEDVRPTFDVFSLGKLIWSMVSGERILRLWYFNKEQFDVTRMFPSAPHIADANALFERCIVEEEEDCLPDATALLEEIDKLLSKFDHAIDWDARVCRICGEGRYQLVAERQHDWEEFGVKPSAGRSFKIHTCDNCGHVEWFTKPERKIG